MGFTTWPYSVSVADTKETIFTNNDGVNANILFISLSNTGPSDAAVDLFLNMNNTDYHVLHADLEEQGSVDGPSYLRSAVKIVVPGLSSIKIQSTQTTVDIVLSGEEYPADESLEWPGVYFMDKNEVLECGLAPGAEIIDQTNKQLHIITQENGDYVTMTYNPMLVLDPSLKVIDSGHDHTLAIKSDNTVVASGDDFRNARTVANNWTDTDIIRVTAGENCSYALKSDGTVLSNYDDYYGTSTEDLINIIDIAAGTECALFLQSDGTIVGRDITAPAWTDITAISMHPGGDPAGIKSDGTVVGFTNSWTDIIAIAAGVGFYLGLKSDGTVVASGTDGDGQVSGVSTWTDIVAIAAGDAFSLGVKSDGTVVGAGANSQGQLSGIDTLTNAVDVSAGRLHRVVLFADGTVEMVGYVSGSFSTILVP